MAKKNKRKDIAETARSIVEQATGAKLTGEPLDPPEPDTRDPAAVELGRRGGLKGGPARAKKLSKKKRREIAKKAANARWVQKPGDD